MLTKNITNFDYLKVIKTSAGARVAIVTLTTDLGLKDYYVGSLKGALLSQFPELQIVDISNEVKAFDILQAAIILKHCYRDFPDGTVHLVGVNPDSTEDMRHLAVLIHKQYFLIPDNGIISLIFDSKPDEVVELNLRRREEMITFPAKDIYVTAACHLARGGSLQVIGKNLREWKEGAMFRAISEEKLIRGMVIYIDHYGNVLTNIDQNLFRKANKYGAISIQLRRAEYEISAISKAYSDVPPGEKLALFNTLGLLEISINQGNASKLLGLRQSDTIRIEFHDR